MTTDMTSGSNKRTGLKIILGLIGGCGLLTVCVVVALTANAIYWTARMRSGDLGVNLSAEQLAARLAELPPGDAGRGEQVFQDPGHCNACHSLNGTPSVGPSLAGLPARAGSTRPGLSAEQYVLEAIISPQAYIAGTSQGAIMPPDYGERLSDQELADLLAYLADLPAP